MWFRNTLIGRDYTSKAQSQIKFFFLSPSPPPQGVSFTFRMGTLPLLSNTDEITACVRQNWTCCLPALHGFCRPGQNHEHPWVGLCNSGASRTRERRRGEISAVAPIWSGHTYWALFTHASCALGLTGFKDVDRYLYILWNKTTLKVSIFPLCVWTKLLDENTILN